MVEIERMTPNYTVLVTPMPAPRVRGRIMTSKNSTKPHVHMYNPADYTKWKDAVSVLISKLEIEKSNWNTLNAVMFIPIPKSYSGKIKQRMHCTLHENKPDWDNYGKAFQDALQHNDPDRGILSPISDDSTVSIGVVYKVWINDPLGKIVFSLSRSTINPLYAMGS
jgi:Holliday junction resolvase RusA-like endonuclease